MPFDPGTSPRFTPSRAGFAPLVGIRLGLLGIVLVLLATAPAGLSGQSPLNAAALTDPVVPKGYLRLDFVPRYSTWDTRYTPTGDVEPLGADLTSDNAASLFPGISTLEQNLRALTGSTTGFPSVLGPVAGRVSKQMTRMEFGARVGIFGWLTLGAMVPVTRVRVPVDIAFRPDTLNGNVGLSPAITGSGAVSELETQLANAADAARARATNLCDADPSSTQCADAMALSARAAAFTSATAGAYTASAFFPLDSSAAATALTAALDALNQDLVAAGLTAVSATFTFPTARVDESTFAQLSATPGTGIRSTALEPLDGLWRMGDVELSAIVRLLDGEVRDSGAISPRLAWELAGGVLVRLGTGQPADPEILFDVGSGDGQTDVEGRLFAALQVGHHVAVRSEAHYGVQKSTTQVRRVVAPTVVLAPYSSRHTVRWSPGSYFSIQVSPRLYLTEQLALSFDYDYFNKGADTYALADPPSLSSASPPDVSVLGQGSSTTVHQAGVGLTYATLRTWREGHTGTPVEMNARLIRVIGGTSGWMPKATRFEIGVRVFHRMWGGS